MDRHKETVWRVQCTIMPTFTEWTILGAVDARVGRHPFDCAVCLAQNGADFYKNYGLSEWDADISDNDTDLNSNAQVISQG